MSLKLKLLLIVLVLISLIPFSLAKEINVPIDVYIDLPAIPTMKGEVLVNVTIGGNLYPNRAISNASARRDEALWTPDVEYNITEDNCDEFTQNKQNWENLTNGVIGVMDWCKQAVIYGNDTRKFAWAYAECEEGKGNAVAEYKKYKNLTAEYKTDADLYHSCDNDRIRVQSDYSSCSTDLTNEQKTNKTKPLIFGAVGLGIGYFLFGTKKRRSELVDNPEMGPR